jgi:hypothetical protein
VTDKELAALVRELVPPEHLPLVRSASMRLPFERMPTMQEALEAQASRLDAGFADDETEVTLHARGWASAPAAGFVDDQTEVTRHARGEPDAAAAVFPDDTEVALHDSGGDRASDEVLHIAADPATAARRTSRDRQ